MKKLIFVSLGLIGCRTLGTASGNKQNASLKNSSTGSILWHSDENKAIKLGKCPTGSTKLDKNCPGLIEESISLPLDMFEERWKEAILFLRDPSQNPYVVESDEVVKKVERINDLRNNDTRQFLVNKEDKSHDELKKELVNLESEVADIQLNLSLSQSERQGVNKAISKLKTGLIVEINDADQALKAATLAFKGRYLWNGETPKSVVCSFQKSLRNDFGYVQFASTGDRANAFWRSYEKDEVSVLKTDKHNSGSARATSSFQFEKSTDNPGWFDGWQSIKWAVEDNFAIIDIHPLYVPYLGQGPIGALSCRASFSEKPSTVDFENPELDLHSSFRLYNYLLREGKLTSVFNNKNVVMEGSTCSYYLDQSKGENASCSMRSMFAALDLGVMPSKDQNFEYLNKRNIRCTKSDNGAKAKVRCGVGLYRP